jgi:hypothetical protein
MREAKKGRKRERECHQQACKISTIFAFSSLAWVLLTGKDGGANRESVS